MATTLTEDFQSPLDAWSWNTPGSSKPADPWHRGDNRTPTESSGPNGGADPQTRAVMPGGGFAYTESSPEEAGPWSLESHEFDANDGTLTLTFDFHMRFGQVGGIDDGTLEVQGWNGTAWSRIGKKIVGSRQSSADSAYQPSSDVDRYDSSAFSNSGFKFRLLFRRGTSGPSPNYDCAVDNCVITRNAAADVPSPNPGPNPNRIPSGVRTIWVDQENGKDGKPQHDGLSPAKAKKTIQAGIKALKPGNVLVVRNGTYYERLAINNLGEKTRIMAETPGSVRISGLWKDAELSKVAWEKKGDVFSAKHGDSFMGSFGDEFLFRYKTVAELKASELKVNVARPGKPPKIVVVKKPPHGFAFANGKIHLRLPKGMKLKDHPVKLTDNNKKSTPIIDVKKSPEIIIDGFVIEGAGPGFAILFDRNSQNPRIRNCKFTHSKFAAKLPHESLIEWSEYCYTGFRNFADALIDLNGVGSTAIFTLVKKYWKQGGGAALEGGLAESIFADKKAKVSGSKDCEFRFNYIHETFDGERLGAFFDSVSHHNVYRYNEDNHIEFESFLANRPCRNLWVHDCLFLDCGAGPLSHQDTSSGEGKGMQGPHYVSHCVIDNRDRKHSHPRLLIKILGLKGTVAYYHCYLGQAAGKNEGFNEDNTIARAMRKEKLGKKLKVMNCIVVGDGLTKSDAHGKPEYLGNLVVDSNKAEAEKIGELVGKKPAALKLGDHYRLLDNSPAIGAAKKLPDKWRWPDGRSRSDVGPFAKGVKPEKNWPRPMRTFYPE